jgi:hypothetical protein
MIDGRITMHIQTFLLLQINLSDNVDRLILIDMVVVCVCVCLRAYMFVSLCYKVQVLKHNRENISWLLVHKLHELSPNTHSYTHPIKILHLI